MFLQRCSVSADACAERGGGGRVLVAAEHCSRTLLLPPHSCYHPSYRFERHFSCQRAQGCSRSHVSAASKQHNIRGLGFHILVAERANSSFSFACSALTSLKRRSRLYLPRDLNVTKMQCGKDSVILHVGAAASSAALPRAAAAMTFWIGVKIKVIFVSFLHRPLTFREAEGNI
jgi:hypothetical protein